MHTPREAPHLSATCSTCGTTGYEANRPCPLHAAAPQLLEALEKIARGEGRYNRDPLEHCSNAVEDMKAIAVAAIEAEKRGG